MNAPFYPPTRVAQGRIESVVDASNFYLFSGIAMRRPTPSGRGALA
jgi:hypothetical protein